MQEWIQQSENDATRRKNIEEAKRKQKMEVKDFLLKQMGDHEEGISSISAKQKKRGGELDPKMNEEELRINKQVLDEIKKRKIERDGGSTIANME